MSHHPGRCRLLTPLALEARHLDLTPHVVPGGVNQLAIRLDNPPESARWYPGGGLCRHVWLVKTDPVHAGQWGTFVRTPKVSRQRATVALDVAIDNHTDGDTRVDVATDIFALDAEGRRIGGVVARIAQARVEVPARGQATSSGSAVIAKPRLWGPRPQQVPHRYVAVTSLSHGGKVVDRYETRFGIRSLRFDADADHRDELGQAGHAAARGGGRHQPQLPG